MLVRVRLPLMQVSALLLDSPSHLQAALERLPLLVLVLVSLVLLRQLP